MRISQNTAFSIRERQSVGYPIARVAGEQHPSCPARGDAKELGTSRRAAHHPAKDDDVRRVDRFRRLEEIRDHERRALGDVDSTGKLRSRALVPGNDLHHSPARSSTTQQLSLHLTDSPTDLEDSGLGESALFGPRGDQVGVGAPESPA